MEPLSTCFFEPHDAHGVQAVDPVLLGKVRAKQYYSDDHSRERNMGILLHGDGSFSGQARPRAIVDAVPGLRTHLCQQKRWIFCWV